MAAHGTATVNAASNGPPSPAADLALGFGGSIFDASMLTKASNGGGQAPCSPPLTDRLLACATSNRQRSLAVTLHATSTAGSTWAIGNGS